MRNKYTLGFLHEESIVNWFYSRGTKRHLASVFS